MPVFWAALVHLLCKMEKQGDFSADMVVDEWMCYSLKLLSFCQLLQGLTVSGVRRHAMCVVSLSRISSPIPSGETWRHPTNEVRTMRWRMLASSLIPIAFTGVASQPSSPRHISIIRLLSTGILQGIILSHYDTNTLDDTRNDKDDLGRSLCLTRKIRSNGHIVHAISY